MLLSSWRWARGLPVVVVACLGSVTACDNSPPPDARNQSLTVGGEVYRMFCMRTARSAYPDDPAGFRFVPLCEGTVRQVPDDIRSHGKEGAALAALIDRRAATLAALDQVLGDIKVTDSQAFADKELDDWLKLLLPFYGTKDAGSEKVIPVSTEALANVMAQLIDPQNQDVLDTLARIQARQGYRAPDRVLAALRPALQYDNIDSLTKALLALVAPDGTGHDAFIGVLQALALELAQPADPKQNPSTLHLALDLVLRSGVDDQGNDVNALFEAAEPAGSLAPLPVLSRDPTTGDAIAVDASITATPFAVAGVDDGANRDATSTLALGADGKPAYRTFDANQTALASLMRDSVSLIQRGGSDRSTVEKLLRSARPLLGAAMSNRKESFGPNETLTYQGIDIEHGPMANFLHAFTTLLKLPETKPMLQVLDQLLATNEAAATELIYAALQIWHESKDPKYATAQLNGGMPHEFWDDLIGVVQDVIANRPGVVLDVLNATLDPLMLANKPMLAHQMTFRDVPKLSSSTDINSEVTTGCTDATAAYCNPVDRGMPDVGMNRSIFQRTMSLIHATYKAEICNKNGATLTVQQPIQTTFPNPPLGPLAPFLGAVSGGSGTCPASSVAVAPKPTDSYQKCDLIQQQSGAVTQMRSMLGKDAAGGTGPGLTKIVIKDDEVTKCAAAVGTDVATAQQRESGITGFTLNPSAKAIARFVYAPRDKFITDMFDPVPTIYGDKIYVTDYEPNGMYPLEVVDPDAMGADGKPVNFITAIGPLLTAFDNHETFNANGDYQNDHYYFAELLDVLHMHYSSPKMDLCPDTVQQGNEGCVQSADPSKPYYVHGTNLVSYEPLIVYALEQQDIIGVLQRSTQAIKNITVDGKDGVTILDAFVEAVLKPNPALSYIDGTTYAKTNLCVVMSDANGMPTCAPDASGNPVGRIIQGGVPAVYLLLDALNAIDAMWAKNGDAHQLYLDVRSTLTDKLIDITKAQDGTTSFTNRRAYALTRRALPWLLDRLNEHPNDLDTWADGLVNRLASVLGHPLAARGLDLFDQFWENDDAGNEVAKLLAYLFDDKGNPEAFTGAVIAAADTLMFLDNDPDYTPAVRFAALGLATDAIDIVSGNGSNDLPDVDNGTAYRFLELTRRIGNVDTRTPFTTLAKLLRNVVLPMDDKNTDLNTLAGKSPLEQFIDVVAEVNRLDPTRPSTESLASADDNQVFSLIKDFLSSDEVGLERLYQVIENRDL